LKFSKAQESGEYFIIPFTTLVFDYQFNLVFSGQTYYFSLTGHDLLEISDYERHAAMFQLCKGIYTSKTVTHALALQIEYYFNNHRNFNYLSSNSFDCLKSESAVGAWINDQIRKLEGDGMKGEYVRMATKLIETKTPA